MSHKAIVYSQFANHALGLYVQSRVCGIEHESAETSALVITKGNYAFYNDGSRIAARELIAAANAFIGEVDAMRRELENAHATLLVRNSELIAAQNRIDELAAELEGRDIIIAELRPEPTPADMGITDETDTTTPSDARETGQGEAQESD